MQPPLDDDAWRTPPFELTEVDGRWYGRGAADCKGNIVMHLAALRALGDDVPVNLKLVVEGSEEQGTGGLEAFVPDHADLLRADAILVCDTGNAAVGQPGRDREPARHGQRRRARSRRSPSELHSGMFGGAAPDALAALVAMLATLRDGEGNTTIAGSTTPRPGRARRTRPSSSAADAGVVDGASLLGDGTVSDMLWARPAVTILGIDCPPVVGSAVVDHAAAQRARLNLRIPPGMAPEEAQRRPGRAPPRGRALGRPGRPSRPRRLGAPFRAATDGPAYRAIADAMQRGLRQADDHRSARAGRSRCATSSPTPTPTPRSS